jgi:hypothetical protein
VNQPANVPFRTACELDANAGDRDAGFVESYLLSHQPEVPVVPIGPRMRRRRAVLGSDD